MTNIRRFESTALARTALLLAVSMSITGCEVIGGIFRAGFWVGAIIILLVLGIVAWLVTRTRS